MFCSYSSSSKYHAFPKIALSDTPSYFSPDKSHSFFERRQQERALGHSYIPEKHENSPDELSNRFFTSGSLKTRKTRDISDHKASNTDHSVNPVSLF